MTTFIKRREFIALISGAAVTWPLAARAKGERVPRIGVLGGAFASSEKRYAAFLGGLKQLGWTDGTNMHIDVRWIASNPTDTRRNVAELVTLAPDVLVAIGSYAVQALLQSTSTIPIVFAIVPDPVGAGFVASLSQPGGNATGFMMFEYSLAGKWLELLKEIAPGIKRAAVLRDPATPAGSGQFAVIQSVSGSVGVEVLPISTADTNQIERGIAAFARAPNCGLIVTAATPTTLGHRDLIAGLAAQYRLPAVYNERTWVATGGLISYGPNFDDEARGAASYVDRILKGERPADLPVQAPTKYELLINLKTAKALGLSVPGTVLARADEVIE
jgi:putative ABC transport system substrate-binding protein